MKTQIVTLSLLISLSSLAYGADEVSTSDETTVQQDIQNTQTIDELIEKMNQTQQQNRYRYMNEIKVRISAQKGKNREGKMQEVLGKITQDKEKAQEHMSQEASEHNNGMDNGFSEGMSDSGFGGSDMGGMGDSMGGMGGDSDGGDSGGGGGGGGGPF